MKKFIYFTICSALMVGLFVFYFWSVTCLTPYMYENWYKEEVKVANVTNHKKLKAEDANLSTIMFGDEYNNERVGVIGTFGDSAGFMNAFFSFLAFAAVVCTFAWQNSKDNKSKKDYHRSQFESVFFNMTNTFEEIVSQLEYNERTTSVGMYNNNDGIVAGEYNGNGAPIPPTAFGPSTVIADTYKGREVFKYLYCLKEFNLRENENVAGIKQLIEGAPDMPLSEIKEKVFDGTLDHYFRYAYRILKYVNESKLIDNEERMQYASVFRAHLSCYELLILFINCIEMDNNKFKNLIEQYCLFNNIRAHLMPDTDNYQRLYIPKIESTDDRERDGYAENADHEYAITAFRKQGERVSVRRFEVFQKVWELRFSRRIEREA